MFGLKLGEGSAGFVMGGGARQGVKISEIGAQILKIGAREMFF